MVECHLYADGAGKKARGKRARKGKRK